MIVATINVIVNVALITCTVTLLIMCAYTECIQSYITFRKNHMNVVIVALNLA